MQVRLRWSLVAIASIWLSVALVSLFSPDLVSGSQQERLPIAAFVTWIWGALATWLVLNVLTRRRESPGEERTIWMGMAVSTTVIWLIVAVIGIFGPVLVAGSDPTRLPLAALVAPAGGTIVTGLAGQFLALLAESAE